MVALCAKQVLRKLLATQRHHPSRNIPLTGAPPYKYMVKYRAVAVAVAVAVSGGGAVAVAVAGLTKRFFNHIQKDFLQRAHF